MDDRRLLDGDQVLSSHRSRPPRFDPTGFRPGEMVVAYQKRDTIPVKARTKPIKFMPGDDSRKLPEVYANDVLIYVGYVEEKLKTSTILTMPELTIRFLAVVWRGGFAWISDADASFNRI